MYLLYFNNYLISIVDIDFSFVNSVFSLTDYTRTSAINILVLIIFFSLLLMYHYIS